MGVQIGLDGKVAIVTGGSRGIGEAIARTFVAQGARVVIASRKFDGVAGVAHSITNEHGADRIRAIAAHTGKEDDCVRLIGETIAAFGKVDVLVNNAGTNPYFGPMLNADEGAWDKTFDVNLKGYFWCAREVARHLAGRSAAGSIINVASIAGDRGLADARRVLDDQGRRHLDDQDARARARTVEYPRERDRPGLRRHAARKRDLEER